MNGDREDLEAAIAALQFWCIAGVVFLLIIVFGAVELIT